MVNFYFQEKIKEELQNFIEEDIEIVEEELDQQFLSDSFVDFSQKIALGYAAGYFLYKTILKGKSHCANCKEAFITSHVDDDQVENTLMRAKDFKEGALTRPSVLGNTVFKLAEDFFSMHYSKLSGKKGITEKMTQLIIKKLIEKIPDITQCHLSIIIRRFVTARLMWKLNNETSHEIEAQKVVISNEANSSRTMKAKNTIK